MASLDSLNALLTQAAILLDAAAYEVRDIPLEPTKQHIRSIGGILAEIYAVQHRIYELRPDLKPAFLNKPSQNRESNRALGEAMVEAGRLEEEGQTDAAIAVVESYRAKEQSNHHRDIAQSLIKRLRERRASGS